MIMIGDSYLSEMLSEMERIHYILSVNKFLNDPTSPVRPMPNNANNFNSSHPIAPQPTLIKKKILFLFI
jgi:hypothetical protein